MFMLETEISTHHLTEAKMLHVVDFEKNSLSYQDDEYKKKEIGNYVFLIPHNDEEENVNILIHDLALTYIKVMKKNNLLLMIEDREEELVFVFADCQSLFSENSTSLIKIKKDKHFEANIKQLDSFFIYYFESVDQVDVISKKEDFSLLIDICPEQYKTKIKLVGKKETNKIINNINHIYSKSFIFKRNTLALASIILPMLIVFSISNWIMTNKKTSLDIKISNSVAKINSTRQSIQQLKENDFFKNKDYYLSLNSKGILK